MNRRTFLRTLAGAAVGGPALAGLVPHVRAQSNPMTPSTTPPRRPNVVVILVDDMGFSDIGCYGSEIRTPHLDRLAEGGLRFTQFYNTARCCPSRASLLTGLYPHQAGVGHMVSDYDLPAYRGHLSDRCVTMAEVLRDAGYATLLSGKWHVGERRPHWPTDRGFDRSFSLISGASSYFRLDPGRQMTVDGEPWTPPDDGSFYMTDAISDRAVGLLKDHQQQHAQDADKPFLLYLAYTAPHWPLHARPEDIERYRGRYTMGWDELRRQRHARMKEMGLIDPAWQLPPADPRAIPWDQAEDPDLEDLKMAVYAAMLECTDRGIGRVMEQVRAMGAEDDTLVLFMSDNGGCHETPNRGQPGALPGSPESYTGYGPSWAQASNTPLRRYKQFTHEGGIATPLIAYWPGRIEAGTMTDHVGHLIDVMPTVLDAAGASYPQTYQGREITPAAGRSLLPVLEGGTDPGHEVIYWEHQGSRAVRVGDWKLVSARGEEWELYDLRADRTETTDLMATHPEKAAEMIALYNAWAERWGVLPWPELQEKMRAGRGR